MAEPFIGEIRMVAFNYPPYGWAFCSGQTMSVRQNMVLFSVLGTTFGGDGASTFALPNLQGRAPMHPGQGPGLSPRRLGETGGSETVTLLPAEMPAHSHPQRASSQSAGNRRPAGRALAEATGGSIYGAAANLSAMSPNLVTAAGGGQAHTNMQPYLAVHFCIALAGLYPVRPDT